MAKKKRKGRGLTPATTKATSAVAKGLAISGEVKLDPPMTRKEREIVRQYRAALMGIVGAFQFAKDTGVRSMALEEPMIFDENVNRRIQAYRDGKEE